jgi:hypothetical protein
VDRREALRKQFADQPRQLIEHTLELEAQLAEAQAQLAEAERTKLRLAETQARLAEVEAQLTEAQAYIEELQRRLLVAAMLVGVLAGESPARGTCPVAPVVISGGGEGDQSVGSPEVKVPVGGVKTRSAPTGGRANRQVVTKANRCQAPKWCPHENRRVGIAGSAETVQQGRRPASSAKELGTSSRGTSRGLRGRHVDRGQPTKARNHLGVA